MDLLDEKEMIGKKITGVYRHWIDPCEYWTFTFGNNFRITLKSDSDYSDIKTDIQVVPYQEYVDALEEMELGI